MTFVLETPSANLYYPGIVDKGVTWPLPWAFFRLLQGLPIEKLLLTGEIQRELQDLAGCDDIYCHGTAPISALIIGHQSCWALQTPGAL